MTSSIKKLIESRSLKTFIKYFNFLTEKNNEAMQKREHIIDKWQIIKKEMDPFKWNSIEKLRNVEYYARFLRT